MTATDTRTWTIDYSAKGVFVQVTLVYSETHGYSTKEAWEQAKAVQPTQIVVVHEDSSVDVYNHNGVKEHYTLESEIVRTNHPDNVAEALLAVEESKADEQAAKAEEPQSRVGRVYIDSEGDIFRVKKSRSGYLSTQVWDTEYDEWAKAWGYSTSTWRELTAEEAKAFGDSTHKCVYCFRNLTDERSKTAGYGPICAGNYGLPWGE